MVIQIHSYNWTEISIYDYVIKMVEDISNEENQPTITNRYPIL